MYESAVEDYHSFWIINKQKHTATNSNLGLANCYPTMNVLLYRGVRQSKKEE